MGRLQRLLFWASYLLACVWMRARGGGAGPDKPIGGGGGPGPPGGQRDQHGGEGGRRGVGRRDQHGAGLLGFRAATPMPMGSLSNRGGRVGGGDRSHSATERDQVEVGGEPPRSSRNRYYDDHVHELAVAVQRSDGPWPGVEGGRQPDEVVEDQHTNGNGKNNASELLALVLARNRDTVGAVRAFLAKPCKKNDGDYLLRQEWQRQKAHFGENSASAPREAGIEDSSDRGETQQEQKQKRARSASFSFTNFLDNRDPFLVRQPGDGGASSTTGFSFSPGPGDEESSAALLPNRFRNRDGVGSSMTNLNLRLPPFPGAAPPSRGRNSATVFLDACSREFLVSGRAAYRCAKRERLGRKKQRDKLRREKAGAGSGVVEGVAGTKGAGRRGVFGGVSSSGPPDEDEVSEVRTLPLSRLPRVGNPSNLQLAELLHDGVTGISDASEGASPMSLVEGPTETENVTTEVDPRLSPRVGMLPRSSSCGGAGAWPSGASTASTSVPAWSRQTSTSDRDSISNVAALLVASTPNAWSRQTSTSDRDSNVAALLASPLNAYAWSRQTSASDGDSNVASLMLPSPSPHSFGSTPPRRSLAESESGDHKDSSSTPKKKTQSTKLTENDGGAGRPSYSSPQLLDMLSKEDPLLHSLSEQLVSAEAMRVAPRESPTLQKVVDLHLLTRQQKQLWLTRPPAESGAGRFATFTPQPLFFAILGMRRAVAEIYEAKHQSVGIGRGAPGPGGLVETVREVAESTPPGAHYHHRLGLGTTSYTSTTTTAARDKVPPGVSVLARRSPRPEAVLEGKSFEMSSSSMMSSECPDSGARSSACSFSAAPVPSTSVAASSVSLVLALLGKGTDPNTSPGPAFVKPLTLAKRILGQQLQLLARWMGGAKCKPNPIRVKRRRTRFYQQQVENQVAALQEVIELLKAAGAVEDDEAESAAPKSSMLWSSAADEEASSTLETAADESMMEMGAAADDERGSGSNESDLWPRAQVVELAQKLETTTRGVASLRLTSPAMQEALSTLRMAAAASADAEREQVAGQGQGGQRQGQGSGSGDTSSGGDLPTATSSGSASESQGNHPRRRSAEVDDDDYEFESHPCLGG